MHITLVTIDDPFDRRAWGGVPFRMREALEKRAEVRVVLVRRERPFVDRVLNRACRMAGGKYNLDNSLAASRAMGVRATWDVRQEPTDVVLAVATSSVVASLDVDVPILHLNDATFRQLRGYYPYVTGLSPVSSLQMGWIDRRAMRRAAACIFSTEWAMRSAVQDHGLDPTTVEAVEFGSLIVPDPWPPTMQRQRSREIELLFISGSFVDGSLHERVGEWWRKGGPRAVRLLDELRARGRDARLSIVGDVPVDLGNRADVRLCGYLDPNADNGRSISDEYLAADVLVDPTPATITGLVLLDAAAHGLPVVVADTGGVSSTVVSGDTGMLLPEEASPQEYADAVEWVTSPPSMIDSHMRPERGTKRLSTGSDGRSGPWAWPGRRRRRAPPGVDTRARPLRSEKSCTKNSEVATLRQTLMSCTGALV